MPRHTHVGLSVYAKTYGTEPDTLFIHCSLAHQGAWAPLIAATGLHGVAFDLPGHGRSADWDGQTDYQAQTAEIALSFCEEPQHVVGHSFGATVALRLALDHPENVRSLTLIEPVFFAAARGTPAFEAHEAAFAPFVDAMERGNKAEAARLFTDIWGSGAPWDSLPDGQRRYITERIHLILAGAPAINDDNAGQLTPGRLEALEIPTLLIGADQSDQVTAAINAILQQRLPNAQSVQVKGTGHMGPISHPKLYAPAVTSFRDTLSSSSW
ncbi:MAG: alpha/beta hydrolase [Pseudomonadota bacterium]